MKDYLKKISNKSKIEEGEIIQTENSESKDIQKNVEIEEGEIIQTGNSES